MRLNCYSFSETSIFRMAGSWTEEHDRLPLKLRIKILLARNQLVDFLSDYNSEASKSSASADDVLSKAGTGTQPDSESLHSASFVWEKTIANLPSEQSNGGKSSSINERAKLKNDTCHTMNADMTVKEATAISSSGCLQEIKVKTEDQTGFFDELDNICLVERRKMLLSRQTFGPTISHKQSDSVQIPSHVLNKKTQHSSGIVNAGNNSVEEGFSMAGNHLTEVQQTLDRDSSKREIVVGLFSQGNDASTLEKTGKRMSSCFKKKISASPDSIGQNILSRKCARQSPAVKSEPMSNDATCPSIFFAANLPSNYMVPVQSQLVLEDSKDDVIDHMLLRDRMMLLRNRRGKRSPEEVAYVDVSSSKCLRKGVSPSLDGLVAPDIAKQGRSTRTRKRRKTLTDSVETALEEDAPGLLQILIEKGVTIDEIKLYGEAVSEEVLDDSSLEESFSELEAIISKLFSQKSSLLKLEPMRSGKVDKVSYCLACLYSLVEQARYLQFRKWPVEWGWCRDLQSFIFVFEKHHRIVLERPEYGYATYFFELLDSLPIDWQIKRLVTAMRLTSCSRITLLENKALVVGDDLSEREAKVLMEYGWLPDTGLGTMLNYCDRVIHDRHEKDTSEWKSRIGKLLVDGYNGGTIVSNEIPKKVEEYNTTHSQPVKLELV